MFAAVSGANRPSGRGGGLSFSDLLCCFTRSIHEPDERYRRRQVSSAASATSPAAATPPPSKYVTQTSSISSEPVTPRSPPEAGPPSFEPSADKTRAPLSKRVSVTEDTDVGDDVADDLGFVEIPTELLRDSSPPPDNVAERQGPLPLKSALHKKYAKGKARKAAAKGPVLLPPAWGQLTLRLHIEYSHADSECRLRVLLERAICTAGETRQEPASPASAGDAAADVASDGRPNWREAPKPPGARRMLQVAIATLPDHVLRSRTQPRALEPRHSSATFKEKFRFRFKTLAHLQRTRLNFLLCEPPPAGSPDAPVAEALLELGPLLEALEGDTDGLVVGRAPGGSIARPKKQHQVALKLNAFVVPPELINAGRRPRFQTAQSTEDDDLLESNAHPRVRFSNELTIVRGPLPPSPPHSRSKSDTDTIGPTPLLRRVSEAGRGRYEVLHALSTNNHNNNNNYYNNNNNAGTPGAGLSAQQSTESESPRSPRPPDAPESQPKPKFNQQKSLPELTSVLLNGSRGSEVDLTSSLDARVGALMAVTGQPLILMSNLPSSDSSAEDSPPLSPQPHQPAAPEPVYPPAAAAASAAVKSETSPNAQSATTSAQHIGDVNERSRQYLRSRQNSQPAESGALRLVAPPPAVSPLAVSPPAVSPPAVSPPAVSPPAVSPPAVSPLSVSPLAVSPPAVREAGGAGRPLAHVHPVLSSGELKSRDSAAPIARGASGLAAANSPPTQTPQNWMSLSSSRTNAQPLQSPQSFQTQGNPPQRVVFE